MYCKIKELMCNFYRAHGFLPNTILIGQQDKFEIYKDDKIFYHWSLMEYLENKKLMGMDVIFTTDEKRLEVILVIN